MYYLLGGHHLLGYDFIEVAFRAYVGCINLPRIKLNSADRYNKKVTI